MASHAHNTIYLYTLELYCAGVPGYHVIFFIVKPITPWSRPPPAATTTKDAFCLLKINKKGTSTGKGKRDYSFLHDAFKQTASGIECVVCGPGPGGFSFAWDDLDPPDGTQRQLNPWQPGASRRKEPEAS